MGLIKYRYISYIEILIYYVSPNFDYLDLFWNSLHNGTYYVI